MRFIHICAVQHLYYIYICPFWWWRVIISAVVVAISLLIPYLWPLGSLLKEGVGGDLTHITGCSLLPQQNLWAALGHVVWVGDLKGLVGKASGSMPVVSGPTSTRNA